MIGCLKENISSIFSCVFVRQADYIYMYTVDAKVSPSECTFFLAHKARRYLLMHSYGPAPVFQLLSSYNENLEPRVYRRKIWSVDRHRLRFYTFTYTKAVDEKRQRDVQLGCSRSRKPSGSSLDGRFFVETVSRRIRRIRVWIYEWAVRSLSLSSQVTMARQLYTRALNARGATLKRINQERRAREREKDANSLVGCILAQLHGCIRLKKSSPRCL